MLNQEQAKQIVLKIIEERNLKANPKPGFEWIINDDLILEVEYGWIFRYQTRLFWETKKNIYTSTGCCPILVDKIHENIYYITAENGSFKKPLQEYGKNRGQIQKPSEYSDFHAFLFCYLKVGSVGSFTTEEEAIDYYIKYVGKKTLQNILLLAEAFTKHPDLSVEDINRKTNRKFTNFEQAKKWMFQVMEIMKHR